MLNATLLRRMEEYEPIKVLGEGSFGKVYLMKHSKTRDLVCTKVRAVASSVATKQTSVPASVGRGAEHCV